MFADLDATLKALLRDDAGPADLRAADVAFDTPDKAYKPAQSTVNLFLHDLAENRTLRDPTELLSRVGDQFTGAPPVIRVDCTYLVTAWSPQVAALKVAEEHRLLALALTWLAAFPVITQDRLRGALATPPQPYPVSIMVAQTREGQSMGEFWNALGTVPRPGFSLTATVTLQPSDTAATYPVTQRIDLEWTSLTQPTLSGHVLDDTLAPVVTATVVELATGSQASVDQRGSFALTGLDFGEHTLRIKVPGRADVDRDVQYALESQIHTLILPSP